MNLTIYQHNKPKSKTQTNSSHVNKV